MSHTTVENLRDVNRKLASFLAQSEPSGAGTLTLSSQEIGGLFSTLLLASDVLRGVSSGAVIDAALSHEIDEYRSYFAKLQALLPSIQTNLLAERARLELERRHLSGVAAWAQASRDTL